MFRFANPQYLYLLIIIPIIWGVYLYGEYRRRKNLKLFGNEGVLSPLMPDVSKYRPGLKFFLQQFALILIIFVIARPQMGAKLETIKKQGVEIEVVLDVSNSMMARDINPSRLEKAKMMVSKLVDELSNDKMGLIVFAGDAYTQLPITSDFVSAKMFLSTINTKMVPTQGTSIGRAINLAANSFTQDETVDKAIIVITDAENHEDDAVGAAADAVKRGIRVDIVGIGTTAGSPIPLGEMSNDFYKDMEGNVVITKLNEQMGQDIARAGNGIYVSADNTNSALRAITSEVRKMKKSDMESKSYS
ncbi:MAG: VWA domain-containing protein, partial [Bacteroidales bacterium]